MIGNSRHLAITRSHTQAPCLFMGCVGRPGTTKTAPLKILRKPVDAIQQNHLLAWQKDMEAWEADEEDERGPRPIPKRVVVGDTTTESLAILWSENPRGLVMLRNELMGLTAGMNQYRAGGRGHDRQVFLDVFDGNTVTIDPQVRTGISPALPYLSRILSFRSMAPCSPTSYPASAGNLFGEHASSG